METYPRPQFKRDSFFSLDGIWEYAIGTEEPSVYDGEILVPYSPEAERSGVNRQLKGNETLYYKRSFSRPRGFAGKVILHIGACDQIAKVYLNGEFVTSHEGGYLPFEAEITLQEENELKIVVTDDASSDVYGRGKQKYKRGGIWYTATSGIWQSVWLEQVPDDYLKSVKVTPSFQNGQFVFQADRTRKLEWTVSIYDQNNLIARKSSRSDTITICGDFTPWSPENPKLYSVIYEMEDDSVESYVGMREFAKRKFGNKYYFTLNGKPIFQNGLLDQGYWKEGIYTATPKEMWDELCAVKRLGFNMLRKHIKVEPLLWYHYCDVLGILVWQDMINGGGEYPIHRIYLGPFIDLRLNDLNYRSMKRSEASRRQYEIEMREEVKTLENVVSLCVWTPFNEGWGQFDSVRIAKELALLDPTRLIDHASGWQDKGAGDFCSKHIYFRAIDAKNDGRRILALTEFGGYNYGIKGHSFTQKEFGYKGYKTKEELTKAYRHLFENEIIPCIENEGLSVTVYTQVSDVEDEVNGLFTYDRLLKFDESELQEINRKVYESFEKSCKND